jgi:hypothetical protein
MSLRLNVYPSFISACYTSFRMKIQLFVLFILLTEHCGKQIFLGRSQSLDQHVTSSYSCFHCTITHLAFNNAVSLHIEYTANLNFTSFQTSRSSATFLLDFVSAATFPNLGAANPHLEAGRDEHMKLGPRGSATGNDVHPHLRTRKAGFWPRMFAKSHSYTRIHRLR